MMQLATIASFLVLLCGFFGTIATIVYTTVEDVDHLEERKRNEGIQNTFYEAHNRQISTCALGVNFKSVSTVLFTKKFPLGQAVEVHKSCSHINPFKPVVFYSHGYFSALYTYNLTLLESLLIEKGYTVYGINWADAGCYEEHPVNLKNLVAYPFSVRNTRPIGDYLARQIKLVIDVCKVPLENIILIGQSLGSHICAYAAKNLQNSNYGKPPLLIGIDPAAPLISNKCKNRFCITDAKRVVALHTSFFGIQKSIATLDLWFNNGFSQPICEQLFPPYGSHIVCSHALSITYLATLLDYGCGYIGVPILPRKLPPSFKRGCSCDRTNCVFVDHKIFDKNDKLAGDYCVSVSSKYPYCTKKNPGCKK